MPFRFLSPPRQRLSRPQRLFQPCFHPHYLRSTPSIATRRFHASARRKADNKAPNYYETLELQPSASPAEIKRQFFTLSKLHHPDVNRTDPTASTRFVAISEAYHVLSSPSKRQSYDAQFHPPSHHHPHHTGSFSSAGYAGSRPPSGLSRRRTQFRGPPPSFYREGGYGAHASKRTAGGGHVHPHPTPEEPEADPTSTAGGFSPGQSSHHHGTAVPHFDSRGHRRTHEGVGQHFARKAERAGAHFAEDLAGSSGSMLFNFVAVSGVLVVVVLFAGWLRGDGVERGGRKREKEGV